MNEPLIMIPAMMCDARVFLPQIGALSAGRGVIVPNPTAADSVEALAQNILDTAPDRFALFGLSFGGIVAMEILRRAPDRVTRLAIMSASAQSEPPSVAADREPLIVMAKAGRLSDAMAQTLKPDHLAPGPGRSDVIAAVQEMAGDLGSDAFVSQSRALQKRPDQQKTMRLAKLPAYVIAGEHDTLAPVRRQEFMAELMPHAVFRLVPEAGHLPTLEAPAASTAILREWLKAPLALR